MGHMTNAPAGQDGAQLSSSVMTPGARWFFGRKGRVPHADTIGGAVLWPKGQGPPHLTSRAKPGPLIQTPALLQTQLRLDLSCLVFRHERFGPYDGASTISG